MTTGSTTQNPDSAISWLRRAIAWLDEMGRGAWIALMVVGFILFWPIGLAILFYMLWSNRMFSKNRKDAAGYRLSRKSSGNSAFDAYRAETLRRLEEEQESFEAFLQRLREAKDQTEFNQFMDERDRKARTADDAPGGVDHEHS